MTELTILLTYQLIKPSKVNFEWPFLYPARARIILNPLRMRMTRRDSITDFGKFSSANTTFRTDFVLFLNWSGSNLTWSDGLAESQSVVQALLLS